jgi:hypothetical protein
VLEYLHTEKKYQPDTALKYYNVQNWLIPQRGINLAP